MKYNPGKFKDIAESDVGKDLILFLQEYMNIEKMKLATRLGHPAVEGIDIEILLRYGEIITQNRYKQAVGHMIRQIMEDEGYFIDSQNVKCRKSKYFASGTRYRCEN